MEDRSGIQTAISDDNAQSTEKKQLSIKSEREVIKLPDVRMDAEAKAERVSAEAADLAGPTMLKPLLAQS